jgi:glycosyltransferase involved in cell wall biosynthesis
MDLPSAGAEQPLISVIIASYNYAHYIGEAIASVLTQDVQSLELIVVDNASTDNTDDVVATFAHDPRLRYFKNETNIGLAPNHNKGLERARGAYIVFVSADDKLLPGHLRRTLDYLEAHPQIDMVYTGIVFMDAESRPFGVRNMSGQLPVDYDGGRNEFAAQLTEGCYIAWPSMLARRSLYDELGPLHNMTAADYELTVRWAAARKQFGYLRTPSASIRIHGPQASGPAYIAEGRDLADFIDILDKFILPETWDLMQGHQGLIAAFLNWRTDYYRQNGGTGISTEIAKRIDDLMERIRQIPKWLPSEHLGERPMISVVVRPGTVIQTIQSLNSLAAQVDAPAWEAIVVSERGPDLMPLFRTFPYADKVRFVRIDENNAPGAARNVGQRLAAGRIITYLEPGNTYAPQHLAKLAHTFSRGALVVRSEARLMLGESHDGTPDTLFRETIVVGLFRGEEDDARDLIADAIPIDAIAHRTETIARTQSFRADLTLGDVWEYWLRLRPLGVTYAPGPTVNVRVLRQRVLPNAGYVGLAESIHRAYPAPENPGLAERRARYIGNVTPHFQRGTAAITTELEAIAALAAILGIEDAVMTETPMRR